MLSQEERMKIFWASSPQNVRPIPTFQFSHSAFSSSYYYWTEPYVGTVTSETDTTLTMNPANINVSLANSTNNLDQNYTFVVDLTDAQDVFRTALNSVPISTNEEIQMVYREYLSDTLAVVQTYVNLIITKIAYNQKGASITACTPRLNLTSTGLIYSPGNIPTLRGFP
jgi:hypothetical protein